MIEFIRAGMMTTVQDQGRKGLAYYGIPQSGAMDLKSMNAANMLVGNPSNAPCFEFTMQGGHVVFLEETMIGITGANMEWELNGEDAGRFQTLEVKTGDVLKGKYSISGMRSYLSVQGMLDCHLSYNSYSTYSYAGLGHPRIKNGDRIRVKRNGPLNKNIINMMFLHDYDAEYIQFEKGPEWNFLHKDSKRSILGEKFKISPNSNRMGARLVGNLLEWKKGIQTDTAPLVPGIVQLPPDGNPIVILQDGQTTGGYPRIGIISGEELDKFNQIQFGKEFSLVLSEDG